MSELLKFSLDLNLPCHKLSLVRLPRSSTPKRHTAREAVRHKRGASPNFSASLPNCFIGDLLFHPHARLLRAGTRNRGVWEIDVDGRQATPICATQWIGTLAANQTNRWFTFNWPASWHMVWTVMPTTPSAVGAQITWSVAVQRSNAEFATYWITVQNLTNVPVTFEGRYAILSRY